MPGIVSAVLATASLGTGKGFFNCSQQDNLGWLKYVGLESYVSKDNDTLHVQTYLESYVSKDNDKVVFALDPLVSSYCLCNTLQSGSD